MIYTVAKASFGYTADKDIIKNLNLTVKPGDILSILGSNGSGKTTLLKCMIGLLAWRKGESLLNGKNIAKMNPYEFWQQVAYVPQTKHSLFSYTVEDMVLLGRSAHIGLLNRPTLQDRTRAEKAMEKIGISHLRNKECSRISGGELQMVLMARALSTEPSLLVLDEPESGLDFKNQMIILNIIRQLADQEGISCVFNTHYPAYALQISKHALLLSQEGNSLYGTTDEIITQENLAKSFGVNVHISEVEANGRIYKSVIPLPG